MNAKHTPGPWRSREDIGRVMAGCGDETFCVADTHQSTHIIRPDDEREANARLIAAAPEMLAMLHTSLAVIASPASFDLERIKTNLRETIAKVEVQS